jgi:hypothetical protein
VGPVVDDDTTFLLRFDGNRTTVDGESPIESSGGTFVPGISGQALHLGDSEYLRFATAGNISPSEGTLEFWVKPDWPGNNPGPENHIFFSIGNYPHNFMSVQNDNWDNVFWFLTHGDNPRTPALETTSGESLRTSMSTWEADVWRHVAATASSNCVGKLPALSGMDRSPITVCSTARMPDKHGQHSPAHRRGQQAWR